MRHHKKLIVYAGASIQPLSPQIKNSVDLRSPVKHGDLYRLLEAGDQATVLIVDGWFGSVDAITLTECRDYLFNGRALVGCSSMGALRAADLWNAGMIGIGQIYTAYRTGLLRSDADVAVSLHPETFAEITVSSVFVRAAATLAARDCQVPHPNNVVQKAINLANSIHFTDRTKRRLLKLFENTPDLPSNFIKRFGIIIMDDEQNPKVVDCKEAILSLKSRYWPNTDVPAQDTKTDVFRTNNESKLCEACSYALSNDDIFCPQCCSVSHEQ
ncbi:TfuA-like protein [Agrobacterium sp. CCNWLW32]|uniref:TfuA-like protein n=1 Tax=unclassified Agrobacterium TaxID=2632611 RepID=UPI00300FA9D3